MERNNLLRPWPLTLSLAGLALFLFLVVSSSSAQAYSHNRDSALQATLPPSTAPAATLVGPTVVIPDTGGDTAYVGFFASWVLWVVLGLLALVLLVTLVMRPRGPVDRGSHHHHDV